MANDDQKNKRRGERDLEVGDLEGTRRMVGTGVPGTLAGGDMGVQRHTDESGSTQPVESPAEADRGARGTGDTTAGGETPKR